MIDADGTTAIPGLIDSHVHITFGDYTPRQQTVGYLESYVHGGVTTAISASEVHVPGRPRDAEGVKALAVAARKCFEHYRPGGMTVHAGSVILEPTLTGNDLGEIAKQGVWLAKAGFGAFATRIRLRAAGRRRARARHDHHLHTGGSSIPGSGAITGDHLLAMKPHVSFHVNGGPTAMPDADFERHHRRKRHRAAGLHRRQPAHRAAVRRRSPQRHDAFDAAHHRDRHADRKRHHAARHALHHRRISRASAASRRSCAIAAATGSNARVYRLNSGLLAAGKAADIVLIDAPDGGTQDNALRRSATATSRRSAP